MGKGSNRITYEQAFLSTLSKKEVQQEQRVAEAIPVWCSLRALEEDFLYLDQDAKPKVKGLAALKNQIHLKKEVLDICAVQLESSVLPEEKEQLTAFIEEVIYLMENSAISGEALKKLTAWDYEELNNFYSKHQAASVINLFSKGDQAQNKQSIFADNHYREVLEQFSDYCIAALKKDCSKARKEQLAVMFMKIESMIDRDSYTMASGLLPEDKALLEVLDRKVRTIKDFQIIETLSPSWSALEIALAEGKIRGHKALSYKSEGVVFYIAEQIRELQLSTIDQYMILHELAESGEETKKEADKTRTKLSHLNDFISELLHVMTKPGFSEGFHRLPKDYQLSLQEVSHHIEQALLTVSEKRQNPVKPLLKSAAKNQALSFESTLKSQQDALRDKLVQYCANARNQDSSNAREEQLKILSNTAEKIIQHWMYPEGQRLLTEKKAKACPTLSGKKQILPLSLPSQHEALSALAISEQDKAFLKDVETACNAIATWALPSFLPAKREREEKISWQDQPCVKKPVQQKGQEKAELASYAHPSIASRWAQIETKRKEQAEVSNTPRARDLALPTMPSISDRRAALLARCRTPQAEVKITR